MEQEWQKGKHGGTFVSHLLQDLKVPGSNLDKDKKFNELEMMHWFLGYIPMKLVAPETANILNHKCIVQMLLISHSWVYF